jgi:small conductance mechanosensitive channel
MGEIIAAESRFLKEPEPKILVQTYGDNSVTILLRAWAPVDVYWEVYWDKMRIIKEKVEKAGMSIPFPQRDVRLIVEKEAKAN